jgi:predicted heme/steroid binding protein
MKIKALTIAAMLVVAAIALVGCSAPAPAPTATPAPVATEAPAVTEASVATEAPAVTTAAAPAQLELTLDELAAYNGKDGKPAYVAIKGVIYDVTNVPAWKNGMHKGNTAGMDLTDVITKSPHGEGVLKNLPVVGKLK